MWNYLDIICFGTSMLANLCWILDLAPDPNDQWSEDHYQGNGNKGASKVEGESVNYKRINNIINA